MWDVRAALLDPVVDLVAPRACVGCGQSGVALCGVCADPNAVHRLESGGLHVVAAGAYGEGLRAAILAYKERGRRDLARPLGALLGVAVARLAADRAPPGQASVVLVWPHSTRSVAAARGGDHLRRLARHAALRAGARPAPGLLVPTRAVLDSAGLGIAARAENLRGAMRARPAPRPDGRSSNPRVVIVDDIVTTGATLRESRRALTEAGWVVLGAAVVAATPRRVRPL